MIKLESKHYKILIYILTLFIVGLFFISIIPSFNNFPTGIDAPHHITWARSFAENTYPPAFLWKGENPSPYPIPEMIFAITHKVTKIPLVELFPYIIISFIILSIIVASLIAKKIFGYYAGLLTLFFGGGLPFLSEHIPIGTLAEAFGTFILFLIFYLFLLKKYWIIPIFILIGLLSHPFTGLFLGIIFVSFMPFAILSRKTRDYITKYKKIIFIITIIVIIIGVLILLVEQFRQLRIINMLLSDDLIITGGNSYTLIEIIQRSYTMPALYLLGILGIIFLLRKSKDINIKIFTFFGFIFALMIFNHKFYINIEPYRFIAYFELFMSIFAAGAVIIIFKTIKQQIPKILSGMLLITIIFFAVTHIYFNFNKVEAQINYYSDEKSLGKLPSDDLAVMQWISKNPIVDNEDYICTLYKWGYWIPAIAQEKVIFAGYETIDKDNDDGCIIIFNSKNKEEILRTAKSEKYRYLYFSSHQPENSFIQQNFEVLFESGNAKLIKIY